MSLSTINRVVITCPVRRLGSLMDTSPLISGLVKHFPGRLVFGPMSSQASRLWRHLIEQSIQDGKAVSLDQLSQSEKDALQRDERVLGIPLADDDYGALSSYGMMNKIVSLKAYLLALDRMAMPVADYYEKDDDHTHPRVWEKGSYFDQMVKSKDGAVPKPAYLNGHLALLEAAAKRDLPGQQLVLNAPERKPIIWTSQAEVAAAEQYFSQRELTSQNTIGLHLTAGTYDVFKDIWPQDSFMAVARHFIGRGNKILLITGTLAADPRPTAVNKDWQLHHDFAEALKTTYATSVHRQAIHHFHGDVLEGAEVIRKCGVFFSAETGPAHIASAVGTPKVTIANSQNQADIWMLTGQRDAGFVKQQRRMDIIGPSVATVIEAIEDSLLHRS